MNKSKSNTKSNTRQEDSDNESVEEPVIKNKQDKGTGQKVRKGSNDEKSESNGGCKELFLKNLPWSANEDSLTEFFGKYGEVSNVKIVKDRNTGKPRGIGFVEFSSVDEAKAAMEDADNIELDGRQITINYSNDKDASRGPRQEGGQREKRSDENTNDGEGTTVFVGNLGFKTTEDTIREFFDGCGEITSIRIAKGDDGRSKGFCHVDFESNESVKKAMSKNGEDLDGRQVRVDASTGRKSNDRGGFRGGRGGSGGRGGFRGGRGNDRRGGRGGRGGRGRY